MSYNITPIGLGASISASWAWGTSLIVGMEVARTKGIDAWLIWAVANTATLAIFGLLTRVGILGRKIFDLKPIKVLALVIQAFCLVIQMTIINKVLIDLGVDSMMSYMISSAIGIIFTLWMYRRGLLTSVITDRWQWGIAIASISTIAVLGATTSVPTTFSVSGSEDILWGIWSACILISGPITDVQHWQRADIDKTKTAFFWGSMFFGVYMLLVLACAHYQFTPLMNVFLLIAVLCVTTSTIDSIAVAMHEISNKTVGTIISCAICLLWGVFAEIGVVSLWSHAGIFRVAFGILILTLAYLGYQRNERIISE